MKRLNRRQFIQTSSWIIGGAFALPLIQSCKSGSVSFGWLTDIHYANAEMKWDRYFSESKDKLAEAMELYNQSELDFIIETGDFKDENKIADKERTKKYLIEIEHIFTGFKGPRYHVLGNHDLDAFSKEEFQSMIENTNIPKSNTYYSYKVNGWRFIVLDACYREDEVAYNANNFEWHDTYLPQKQLSWLNKELKNNPQPTCVFIHQPIDDQGQLYVKNSAEVRSIIEKHGNVLAVFQGHRHEGGYRNINGIHYITQKAMVDFSGAENSSYSIVNISNDGVINIRGYRRASTFNL